MKKLLLIIFISTICQEVYSKCNDDIDRNWFWTKSSSKKYNYYSKTSKWEKTKKTNASYQVWEFKNKTNKKITIKRIGLYASDNQTKMKQKNVNLYIKPFGVRSTYMYVGDLNLDVAGSGFSACFYGEPEKRNALQRAEPKKKYNFEKKPKLKKPQDNFTLFNLILLALSGALIMIFVMATKKNEYNDYIKKFPQLFEFANSTVTCFKKYNTFKGRASRKEYWYFYLFTILVSILTYYIDISIFRKDPDGTLFINAFFSLLTLLPSLAAGSRRLHDVNKSGWWQLISLTVVGLIPLIIWMASKPVKKNNKY